MCMYVKPSKRPACRGRSKVLALGTEYAWLLGLFQYSCSCLVPHPLMTHLAPVGPESGKPLYPILARLRLFLQINNGHPGGPHWHSLSGR